MMVAVIGGGVIGEAVAKTLTLNGYNVVVAEKRIERVKELEGMGLKATTDNRAVAKQADIIVVCVKPKDVKSVLEEINEEIRGKILISLAAAVTIGFIKKLVPEAKVVRAMPNLAISVGESFTAYSTEPGLRAEEKEKVIKLLRVFGVVEEIDESYMDAITALSGCAPAYMALIAEAMIYAGLEVGLERNLAMKIAAQVMIGTGKLILEGQKTPSQIRDMVTTPGGVTIEGLFELEKFPIRYAFMSAVKAAKEKSRVITSALSEGY